MIDSVPLIQNANDAQQINASIIALKKASRELDEKIAQFNKLLSQEITNREKAITEAINSLDVPSVGGSGKYISAISETDGKISATAGDITSTVSSGNSQPVTSGGVAETLNNPIIRNFSNQSGSDKIIHLGSFTPSNSRQIGAIVELEITRADSSGKVVAVVGTGTIYVLQQTPNMGYYSEVFLYRTDDKHYDLYVKAVTWANTFMKLTATVNFTFDGSTVSSYIGTQVTPSRILSTYDLVDTVVSGNGNPVTSGAVYTELLKYVRAVSNINPTITRNFTNFIDIVACDSTYGIEDIYNKMTNQSILFCYARMLKNRPYPRDGFALLFRIDSSFGGAFYFANGGNIYYTYNDNKTWTAWRQI